MVLIKIGSSPVKMQLNSFRDPGRLRMTFVARVPCEMTASALKNKHVRHHVLWCGPACKATRNEVGMHLIR